MQSTCNAFSFYYVVHRHQLHFLGVSDIIKEYTTMIATQRLARNLMWSFMAHIQLRIPYFKYVSQNYK